MPPNEDDWRGVTNPVERKKRQNRLRQRAWRSRKQTLESFSTSQKPLHYEGYGMLIRLDVHSDKNMINDLTVMKSPQNSITGDLTAHVFGSEVCGRYHSETRTFIPPLLQYSALTCTDETPQRIDFPLSPDHCLITLVRYNVVRAFIHNMSILSLLHHLPPGCSRLFGVSKIVIVTAKHIPLNLQSTSLQISQSPPFWINAIPFPKLRDNLMLMAGQYDGHEFLLDLGLRVYEGFDDTERCGFLVWGEPWLAAAWEVSEGFVRRWGFLLTGCSEVIEAANRWRVLRGDERLVVDI